MNNQAANPDAIYPGFLRSAGSHLGTVQLIFTPRGLLLLIFVLLLLSGPVIQSSDIVAAVTGFSLGLTIPLLAAITLAFGLLLRSNLEIRLSLPGSASANEPGAVAGRPARLFIRTSGFNLPPLYLLRARIYFQRGSASTTEHRLSGSSRDGELMFEDIRFPHRGIWDVALLKLTFGDQLGLSSLEWEMRDACAGQAVEVSPPPAYYGALPVLSSCHRAGDTVSDTSDALGDPYELKPYHPADGMRRILWKIYAKTGELIARHPERAVTPEGQVIIFCLAGAADDHVCSALLSYLDQLEELSLEIFCGCEGQGKRHVARSAQEARELLIESVWDTAESTPSSVLMDLAELLQHSAQALHGGRIERVLIFFSPSRLHVPGCFELLTSVAERLENQGIKPVFMGIEPAESSSPAAPSQQRYQARAGLMRYFWHQDDPLGGVSPHRDHQFMKLCAQRNWEVLLAT